MKTASIQIENINGPILLQSRLDDEVWPSGKMSDMLEARIKSSRFNFEVENIKYDNTGNLISVFPNNL